MTDFKDWVEALTALTAVGAADDDELPIRDASTDTTKRITVAELRTLVGAGASTTPRYTNPLGSGFRKKEITTTITGGLYTGDPQEMLNGYPVSGFFWSSSAAARSIKWTFPEAVRMTGIFFVQDNGTSNGSWQMAGSNDGVSWTDLGSPFAWGSDTEGTWTNTNYYTQYRLTLDSGSTSSSPYCQSVFFKLCTQVA
jgi:hypothetical protein